MASRSSPDIIVVGGGIIGLSIARALAREGVRLLVIDRDVPGMASRAAAGLLAPTIEAHGPGAFEFAVASRDAYPAYLSELQEASGIATPHALDGILRVAILEGEVAELRAQAGGTARWLEPAEVNEAEPSLAPTRGALLHEGDGWVDNVSLMKALATAVAHDERITVTPGTVTAVERSVAGARLVLEGAPPIDVSYVVLAAGAWSPLVAGCEFARWVEPLRGQMLSIPARGPKRPVYGAGAYLVPRGPAQTLVGATSEAVGYDATTTPKGAGAALRLRPKSRTRARRHEAEQSVGRPSSDDAGRPPDPRLVARRRSAPPGVRSLPERNSHGPADRREHRVVVPWSGAEPRPSHLFSIAFRADSGRHFSLTVHSISSGLSRASLQRRVPITCRFDSPGLGSRQKFRRFIPVRPDRKTTLRVVNPAPDDRAAVPDTRQTPS